MATPKQGFYLPVEDSAGNLVPNVTVSLVDSTTGTTFTGNVWLNAAGTQAANPSGQSFTSGVIQLYFDYATTLDITVTGASQSFTMFAYPVGAGAIILKSPNGTRYIFSVTDSGALVTTQVS